MFVKKGVICYNKFVNKRDNQFISIVALHQSAGCVRHRHDRRGAAGRADHHGPLGADVGPRHVAGHPPDVRLGRIRSRGTGIRVARNLRIPDRFGRRTVRLRRGSGPLRPKKMTNRTIICTPAASIFGEILYLCRDLFSLETNKIRT